MTVKFSLLQSSRTAPFIAQHAMDSPQSCRSEYADQASKLTARASDLNQIRSAPAVPLPISPTARDPLQGTSGLLAARKRSKRLVFAINHRRIRSAHPAMADVECTRCTVPPIRADSEFRQADADLI